MLDQIEDLLRAGHWLGPAVLGALCYRLLVGTPISAPGDDVLGAALLATSAVMLTVAGIRLNADKHAAIGPLVFGAMFIASWTMR
jgi:hypothetical protein